MVKRLLIALALMPLFAFSQGELSGKVVESQTEEALANVRVLLIAPIFEFETFTDENGVYTFKNLPNGSYTISVAQDGYFESSTFVDYVKGETTTVEDLKVERVASSQSNNDIPVVEAEDIESGNGSNGTSFNSLLNSSRDIFAFNASMNWFAGRFNFRGKRKFNQKFMVNNIPFENVMWNNFTTFSDFTGLNDAMRSRNTYYGIKAIPFDFGATGNTANIDMRAIKQRRGFRLTQVFTNASYFSRTSLSYHTGLMKNGFAVSALGSFRGQKKLMCQVLLQKYFRGICQQQRNFQKNLMFHLQV